MNTAKPEVAARALLLRTLARLAYEVDATPADIAEALGVDVSDAWAAAEAAGYIADGSVTLAGARYLDHALTYRSGRPVSLTPEVIDHLRADGFGGQTQAEMARHLGVATQTLRRALRRHQ
jgi:DNA-binding MarR family transcriptional regulator